MNAILTTVPRKLMGQILGAVGENASAQPKPEPEPTAKMQIATMATHAAGEGNVEVEEEISVVSRKAAR